MALTINRVEVMHALHKGQAAIFQYGAGIMGEARLIERRLNVCTPETDRGDQCARTTPAPLIPATSPL